GGAAAGGGAEAVGEAARRHRRNQNARVYLRRRPQAVAAEGHRARAFGLDAFAAMAPWRYDFWPAAARLFVQDAEEGLAARAQPCDLGPRTERAHDRG